MKHFLILLSAILTLAYLPPAVAETAVSEGHPEFSIWLKGIRLEAEERGMSQQTLKALDGLEPDPRIIKFDQKQPEFIQTFEEYLTARVTPYRIKKGRKYYKEHRADLEKIAKHYQVDAAYIVAFWGLESNFGSYQGKYSILRSLATLAHNPRRTTFFTKELFKALQILDEGHIGVEKFVGGWAGAMGQNQFMPSSFINFAQDFDGDGKKNIWNNKLDIWASIANYLNKNRWKQGEIWGLSATLTEPVDFDALMPAKKTSGCRAKRHHTQSLSLAEWKAMGVKVDTEENETAKFSMVRPDADEKRAYLVGPNFRGILAYNCANKYAVSVGLLADYIAE